MNENDRWHALIAKFQVDQISDEELVELENALRSSPEARRLFHRTCRMDARLRGKSEDTVGDSPCDAPADSPRMPGVARSKWLNVGLAAAVVALMGALSWSWIGRPEVIATIASMEDAAWRSSLPTQLGSDLTAGELQLASGIATIRFRSGAEVVLEGPATLSLESAMRARLSAGVAMVDVPESAVGFVLDTPEGYAVDYGTTFSVRVDAQGRRSDFELIEGEIAVHHQDSGEGVRLTEKGKTASVTAQSLLVADAGASEIAEEFEANVLRIRTSGRWGSVRRHPGKRAPRRDVLIARRNASGDRNAHSFFAFDLSRIDLDRIESARFRINLVPGKGGFAARLPKINRFAVHGLNNPEKAEWENDSTWDTAPQPEDGILLGRFEIPRSQSRGSFGIRGEELLGFLKTNRSGEVTLILSRETTYIPGVGKGMTHHFASESHPEAVGPMLEFTMEGDSSN